MTLPGFERLDSEPGQVGGKASSGEGYTGNLRRKIPKTGRCKNW